MKKLLLLIGLAFAVNTAQAGEPEVLVFVPEVKLNDPKPFNFEFYGGGVSINDGEDWVAGGGTSVLLHNGAFGAGVDVLWYDKNTSEKFAYNFGIVGEYTFPIGDRWAVAPVVSFRFMDVLDSWEWGIETGGKVSYALNPNVDLFVKGSYTFVPDESDLNYIGVYTGLRFKF